MRATVILLTLLLLAAPEVRAQPAVPGDLAQFKESLTELPGKPSILRGRVYVPAYSSLSTGGGLRLDLAVTLAIRNVSEKAPLVIERIEYFSDAGLPIEKYLPRAIAIKPYGSIEIMIPKQGTRGGTSANFKVDWSSPEEIDEPIIEAVMTASQGTQGYSFISVGRKVSRP
ncbi:DUF3124 domain-containing protein [Bradyrhizobium lablabi]|uniref:DUF3124 domain-containing protein n=1 Tax=Bradyrhizobium lablabi TaxID=722472 RepID=UPI001BA851AB|nr:DUF3124 domain-containing protein [Bradyrhizobium lablabi]MBR0695101.1 DUF3124 domain-containing protein [Bradyrhizobium lablabi]